VENSHDVSSNGSGYDFLAGVELARKALPRFANTLDIPMGIMKADRWVAPWISGPKKYNIYFCVDGFGYVIRRKDGASHRFSSHLDLAKWLSATKAKNDETNIWQATGIFDKDRQARIATYADSACNQLFKNANFHNPPSHVRPGEHAVESSGYYISDFKNI